VAGETHVQIAAPMRSLSRPTRTADIPSLGLALLLTPTQGIVPQAGSGAARPLHTLARLSWPYFSAVDIGLFFYPREGRNLVIVTGRSAQ